MQPKIEFIFQSKKKSVLILQFKRKNIAMKILICSAPGTRISNFGPDVSDQGSSHAPRNALDRVSGDPYKIKVTGSDPEFEISS